MALRTCPRPNGYGSHTRLIVVTTNVLRRDDARAASCVGLAVEGSDAASPGGVVGADICGDAARARRRRKGDCVGKGSPRGTMR